VTHRFPLVDIHKALDIYINRKEGAIKVVLEPQA
jgi:threonine dehydrogenase-like Zn-dependent dehydrogenase